MLARPERGEYADYYHTYIGKVPEGNVIDVLERQGKETVSTLSAVDENKGDYRYAPGKWSLKQVLGHVCDIERVFTYRALSFARADATALPGVEQDDMVAAANFDERTLADIVDEFQAVRASTLAFFRSLDDATWVRKGNASGFDFTVRAIAFIVAGHELHHMGVITERYL